MQNPNKVLLIVFDGVGEAPPGPGNAVKLAKTPFLDSLYEKYPWTLLHASGNAVGVTEGYDGSSEAGHLTMGAGRIVWQPLEEISQVIKKGQLGHNPEIRKFIKKVISRQLLVTSERASSFKLQASSDTTNNDLAACSLQPVAIPTLHLVGMISDGGIHSHIEHLFGILDLLKENGITNVLIHAIADGRDVRERTVKTYIEKVQEKLDALNAENPSGLRPPSFEKGRTDSYPLLTKEGRSAPADRGGSVHYQLSTLIGRLYAMDRALNWDRTQKAYDLLAYGHGETVDNLDEALEAYYSSAPADESTDYYIPPLKFDSEFHGIQPGDSVLFWNFRSDRMLQLTSAFAPEFFSHFHRNPEIVVPKISFLCIGPYSNTLPIAFPAQTVSNNLSSWLSQKGISQLKIAEEEKFAHVTFFFNSQTHDVYKKEDRIMIPSKKVETFAQAPDMSAREITNALLPKLKKEYGLIVVNFANGDVVGHSGDLPATIQAIQTLDECAAKIIPEALKNGYKIILTADHGNAEEMLNPDGTPNPSHTTNPVRCLIIGAEVRSQPRKIPKSQNPKIPKGADTDSPPLCHDDMTSLLGKERINSASSTCHLPLVTYHSPPGLSSIAPTILDALEIEKPSEMTGKSLLGK